MANVLNEEKKQQVLALGRLGWPLRKIQQATRIRRETASQYLKAAGIAVRPPGGWGRRAAKPANEVITDFGAGKPAIPATTTPNCNPNTNPENLSTKGKAKPTSKPANEVITDSEVTNSNPSQPEDVCALASAPVASPQRSPSASACEPYREAIELGLSRGRNAVAIYQDLVDEYSFASSYQSVQRFVRKLRGAQAPEARAVIVTAPGQEAQVDYGTGPMVRDPETHKYRRTRLFVMTLGCRCGCSGSCGFLPGVLFSLAVLCGEAAATHEITGNQSQRCGVCAAGSAGLGARPDHQRVHSLGALGGDRRARQGRQYRAGVAGRGGGLAHHPAEPVLQTSQWRADHGGRDARHHRAGRCLVPQVRPSFGLTWG